MPAASSSSQLDNTSAILGEYMLKGWTLTDLHCDACQVTPLMREPTAAAEKEGRRERIQFCALCDGGPYGRGTSGPSTSLPTSILETQQSATLNATTLNAAPTSKTNPRSAMYDTTHQPEDIIGAPDPAESISSLLLRGYSLLGSNCPNSLCKGIPLVGYPRKKDGSKDTRRLCVSCGGRWIDGNDLGGMSLSAKPSSIGNTGSSNSGSGVVSQDNKGKGKDVDDVSGGESPRTKRRRELYGMSLDGRPNQANNNVETSMTGLTDPEDANENADIEALNEEMDLHSSRTISTGRTNPKPSIKALDKALENTTSSLANTLDHLASSLDRHSRTGRERGDEGRYFVDIKLHTEAIKDVLDVLDRIASVDDRRAQPF